MLNEDFLQSYGLLFFHSYIINDWFVVGKKHSAEYSLELPKIKTRADCKSSFPVD